MKTTRKRYSADFKAKAALESIRGDLTLADLAAIPMRRGFLYLVAIMDWATLKALAWRLSNTMDAGFCVAALEEALARFGKASFWAHTVESCITASGRLLKGRNFSRPVPSCRAAFGLARRSG